MSVLHKPKTLNVDLHPSLVVDAFHDFANSDRAACRDSHVNATGLASRTDAIVCRQHLWFFFNQVPRREVWETKGTAPVHATIDDRVQARDGADVFDTCKCLFGFHLHANGFVRRAQ